MNKLVIALCLMIGSVGHSEISGPARPVDMKTAPMCLFELLKEQAGSLSPYFVIACGSDVVMTHSVSSYSAIVDKPAYKAQTEQVLRTMMGSDASISCKQYDAEFNFIVICNR